MSAVVIQELTAGASDAAEVREYDVLRRRFERTGRLLVPDGEDWWMVGKILNSLLRGARSRTPGRPVAISKPEQQRLVRDVLIARSAKRVGATVVTENLADFRKIRRFCDVRVLPPTELFV
ncbi:MAG TPA: hypothetical protein VHG91_15985 [Longimicrobium sp.]|nr:hypothetical protein [Longimicrobium sp.]